MKVKMTEGAIISIPLDDSHVICKILYLSSYFKNTALFKVFTKRLASDEDYKSLLASLDFELFYSGTKLIQNGNWSILGVEPVSPAELECNRRIVGGDVWLADECLGSASDDQIKELPKMKVYNVSYIEQKASKFAN